MGMTNVDVCTTDDFAKRVGALAFYIGPRNEGCKTYPNPLFGRSIVGGCGVMGSVPTLPAGGCQGMGDVDYGEIYDICFLPELLRLFGGPSCSIMGMMNTRRTRSARPTRACSSTTASSTAA